MEVTIKDHQVQILISSIIRVLQDIKVPRDIKDLQDLEIKVHQIKDPCVSMEVTIKDHQVQVLTSSVIRVLQDIKDP